MTEADITTMHGMGRWEPDSRGRLQEAALALYAERGFENTTVAEIAERAGLTERTFFRYFADKREVLFDGGHLFQNEVAQAAAAAPESATPLEAAAAGLGAAASFLGKRRDFARRRHAVIAASAELRERELIKLASLADALAVALEERGLDAATAGLTAETAVAVFRVAFERWVTEPAGGDLAQLIRDSLDQLRILTAGV
jgi:AcrR family transcriptional regulator